MHQSVHSTWTKQNLSWEKTIITIFHNSCFLWLLFIVITTQDWLLPKNHQHRQNWLHNYLPLLLNTPSSGHSTDLLQLLECNRLSISCVGNFIIEDMHNFVRPKNRYEFISKKAQRWMASWPQAQITRKQRDNKDVSTSGVATTGKVDVLKIWKESP